MADSSDMNHTNSAPRTLTFIVPLKLTLYQVNSFIAGETLVSANMVISVSVRDRARARARARVRVGICQHVHNRQQTTTAT